MLLRFAVERQEISSQLFDDKAIERLVAIQGCHDVVPISPGVAVRNIFIEAVGVCIPRDVEPMSSPAFAVSWRCEQPIDNLRKRSR